MTAPLARLAAVVATLALVAAACGGGDDERSADTTTTTRRAPATTTTAAPTTTTAVPDLTAVKVTLTPIANGLARPTATAVRAGDRAIYVTEKAGRVRAIVDGRLTPDPVLDLTKVVGSAANEQGLLGLAFSPDGARLYVDYTDRSGDTHVDELAWRDGKADASTRRTVLTQDQPQWNHNGGQLAFGPDGLLYIGLGDGGAAGDVGPGHVSGGNGQSLGTWLGKILRVDPTPSDGRGYTVPPSNPFVGRAGARPEIWAYGLRNPWRFSFDAATGDLWIGDVGQNAWEEVDHAPAGTGAGANYGWNVWEANHRFRAGDAPGAVAPLLEYSHDDGHCAVTGGSVYRGARIPALRGAYVYADYCYGEVRAVSLRNGAFADDRSLDVRGQTISSFGVDPDGELLVVSDGGAVARIDPA